MLTVKTLEAYERGIEVADLPRTFQDAVWVTRKPGIQFLWINVPLAFIDVAGALVKSPKPGRRVLGHAPSWSKASIDGSRTHDDFGLNYEGKCEHAEMLRDSAETSSTPTLGLPVDDNRYEIGIRTYTYKESLCSQSEGMSSVSYARKWTSSNFASIGTVDFRILRKGPLSLAHRHILELKGRWTNDGRVRCNDL